jgi:hypothetical protein
VNELSPEERDDIKKLLLQGNSPRRIAALLGCSHITVRRYQKLWAVSANCGCGKPAGHQEWCSFRLKYSPKRSAWLSARWAARSTVLETIRLATAQTGALGHQLGPFVWSNLETAASVAYATCRVCGKSVRVFGGNAQWERYQKWQRFAGAAVNVQCKTKEQLAAERAAAKEKRSWQAARRTLREIKSHLRRSHSPRRASTPERSSHQ